MEWKILGNLLNNKENPLNWFPFEGHFLFIVSSPFICKCYFTKPNKSLNALFFCTPNTTAEVISVIATPVLLVSPRGKEPLQLNPVKLFNGPVMMADAVWALSPTALSSQRSVWLVGAGPLIHLKCDTVSKCLISSKGLIVAHSQKAMSSNRPQLTCCYGANALYSFGMLTDIRKLNSCLISVSSSN